MNSKTTPQFSLKDLHDWKSGHHHPPVEDSEDFERLATTIKALAAAEKERDEAYAMLECQVDSIPPCHGPGKQDYDMCRACLLSRCRRVERERDEARADLARVAANRGELVLVVARTVEERDTLKAALRRIRDIVKQLLPVPGFPKCDSRCASNSSSYEEDPRCDCGMEEIRTQAEKARALLKEMKP